jgi:hypothetical protein
MAPFNRDEVFTPEYRINLIKNVSDSHTSREWTSVTRDDETNNANLLAWVRVYNNTFKESGSSFGITQLHRRTGRLAQDEYAHVIEAWISRQDDEKIVAYYNIDDESAHDIKCAVCGSEATHYVSDIVVVSEVPLTLAGERDYTMVEEHYTTEEENGENLCGDCKNDRLKIFK